MNTKINKILILVMMLTLITPMTVLGDSHIVQATILHTNDFHGRLETDYRGRGGSAYVSDKVNDIRADVGEENVVLMDAGDVYFAAPAISQLLMGVSTIDVYNLMGYDLAAFGNHEFDKGQDELAARVAQSDFPWIGANVVMSGTEWTQPDWAQPYEIIEVGSGKNKAKLGVLGLAGEETPEVTLIGTTEGLVFKDLTETTLYYYDEIMAQSDALVVLVHMGTGDSGPYDGLETVAQNMIDAGKPLDLMIGGHQHQALFEPVYVESTAIVSAGYYGRWLGQVDVSIDKDAKELTLNDYQLHTITAEVTLESLIASVDEFYELGDISSHGIYNGLLKILESAQDQLSKDHATPAVNKLQAFMKLVKAQGRKHISSDAAESLLAEAEWILDNTDMEIAARVAYWADAVAPIVNQTVGYTNISLVRDYNNESNMGDIVTDSMLWSADLYDDGELNGTVDIAFTNPGGLRENILIPEGASLPYEVTWGDTFNVLPFGNTLFMMDLTGAQIQELLDQSAKLYKGILQTSGASYYWYNNSVDPDVAPTAWGAYGVDVAGEPLDRDEVYRVVTNDFLAGGQDGWSTFADGTNRWNTYFDMQQGFVEYIGMLEVIDAEDIPMGRIIQLDDVITMLHVNDTHGRWAPDYYGGGMTYIADLVEKERAHNPDVLLFDAGDTFQGNSFAYFFKDRSDNPIAGGMNLLDFDAMVVGNHEFNFGNTTFATMLGQVNAPLLGTANMDDDGSYGFINDNLSDYINLDVNGKKVTVFGLTNPRIYRYELPTNIPGLTFYSAVDTAVDMVPTIEAAETPDLFLGLTHVGYQPYGGEVDSDELIAQSVGGLDVIIGGHSHTLLDPAVMVSDPTNNPDGTLIAHARRYAGFLGKVNVGWIGDEMVLREGYLIPTTEAVVNTEMADYLAPYLTEIDEYNETVIGDTEVPIDALEAYTEETNGANLQADAAIWELADKEGVAVDLHLSGAMSNRLVAEGATPTTPVELTKGDMFTLMPYENSLVVLSMNGLQIKEVLERSYRNWWWFNQGYPWGGYSHYTTCMLATNEGNVITYTGDLGTEPDGNNVASLTLDGVPVDLADATTTYLVSTVNYVAAGSCNFNNDGETIWPLDQIAYDTQLYVRDSVINYVDAQIGPIAPAIEGRLQFP